MALPARFTDHPDTVGESYAEHMRFALHFAGDLAVAAGGAMAHAVCPWTCQTTASDKIRELHGRLGNDSRRSESYLSSVREGAA